jgi:hypothetical protein
LNAEFTDIQSGIRAAPPCNMVTNVSHSNACFFRVVVE